MDQAEEIRKIRESQERMERWLVGDEKGGQFGLIARTNNHASRIKTLERWVFHFGASAAAAATILGLLYKLLVDWWPHK
jgi:hypothetical protein